MTIPNRTDDDCEYIEHEQSRRRLRVHPTRTAQTSTTSTNGAHTDREYTKHEQTSTASTPNTNRADVECEYTQHEQRRRRLRVRMEHTSTGSTANTNICGLVPVGLGPKWSFDHVVLTSGGVYVRTLSPRLGWNHCMGETRSRQLAIKVLNRRRSRQTTKERTNALLRLCGVGIYCTKNP